MRPIPFKTFTAALGLPYNLLGFMRRFVSGFLTQFCHFYTTQIARSMGPTWGPPGSCRPQMGPCWPHEPCYQGNFWQTFGLFEHGRFVLFYLWKWFCACVCVHEAHRKTKLASANSYKRICAIFLAKIATTVQDYSMAGALLQSAFHVFIYFITRKKIILMRKCSSQIWLNKFIDQAKVIAHLCI